MRLDVYSVAYEEANSELLDIRKRFEQLRRRKECLELVIATLSPILASEQVTGRVGEPIRSVPQPIEEPVVYTFNQVAAPLPDVHETGGDPFQRRVRSALKEHRGLQTAV
jgi:hypothetical protein